MKVILTGSTGTVGSAVLDTCIAHPSVTSIVALTRRPLAVTNEKLNNIVHKDFLEYDNDVLDQLQGAEACIWALGTPTSGEEVHRGYTMAAINAFRNSVIPNLGAGKKFRFILTSGGAVPYLGSKAFFFFGKTFSLRADMDREVLALENQDPDRWESYVARPWYVVDAKPLAGYVIENSWILRSELAAAMVEVAVNGGKEKIMSNADMRRSGLAAMKAQS